MNDIAMQPNESLFRLHECVMRAYMAPLMVTYFGAVGTPCAATVFFLYTKCLHYMACNGSCHDFYCCTFPRNS